jgi:hypothetical protein
MLFRDIIAPYPENYTKHINATCEENGDFMHADDLGKLGTKKSDVTQKPIMKSFHSSTCPTLPSH